MGDRYRTADGWSVEVIGLALTPDRHDGEWLKVSQCGAFVALVRTVAELGQWFPPAALEPDGPLANRAVRGLCRGEYQTDLHPGVRQATIRWPLPPRRSGSW